MRRIAVVGAGVSGLVAAAELHRAGHDVHVFEAGEYPGGHTNTIDVETPGGQLAVDTGFIVFNEVNYPNFERMLAELGVVSQPTDMSFSVSDGRGGFEWATTGPRGLFARPAHALDPRFHRMLRDLVRFNREARKLVGSGGRGPSLRRFLADGGYSDYFVERLLVPQASAVWSADPAQMWRFPAGFLAEFFDNHRVLQLRDRPSWRSITGGSRRYVEALIAPFHERVNLRAPVRRIHRVPDGVVIALDDSCERFDEVVIAVHSDVALRMLADPAPAEADVLGAIPYQRNEAVLHTDACLMPQRRSAWASWNYHLIDRPTGRTTVTYHMNRLQSLVADRDYLVTLNLTEAVDPARVIRKIDYAHPVFTPEGVAAQRRWAEISGLLDAIPLWSARRPAPAHFRDGDYLPGDGDSLAERARNLVDARLGRRPAGPVRLLANPRYLGVGFNPVSFLFLHTPDGGLDSAVAEVTNTPWGERTVYVLDWDGHAGDEPITCSFEKGMHVSPFQSMEQTYEISVTRPSQRLGVVIRNREGGREVFAASMALRRSEVTRTRMLRLLLRYPPMTVATLARIYVNALRLKLRGAPFHPHPEVRDELRETTRHPN